MKKTVLFWITVFLPFVVPSLPVLAAGDYVLSASAVFQNSKNAFEATTLQDAQTYAQGVMTAANDLKAAADETGNTNLANLAQGAYNYAKRVSDSSSLFEAKEYAERAVSFAKDAAVSIGEFDQARIDTDSRENPNVKEDYGYYYLVQ